MAMSRPRPKVMTLTDAAAERVKSIMANAAKPVLGTWGYDQSAMNRSVKPGDDFWAYVNGNWDQRTQN